MNMHESLDTTPRRRFRIRRRTAFRLGLVIVLVIYPLMVGVLPWAVSLLAPRYGWTERGPGPWNWPGLALVAAGAAGLVWVFGTMFAQFPRLPEVVEFDEGENLVTATSRILITHGPFAVSRNPMFLSGLIVWLGWAIFYGSIAVGVAIPLFWAFSNYLKVPQEERGLEARFGDEFRDYKRRVPRWLGIPRRG
jgi:protein-S-isoprenylcysteine O-methyltransferase Ste14